MGADTPKWQMVDALESGVCESIVSSRKPARNTLEFTTSNGSRHVVFHRTEIVTVSPDGRTVTFDSGGWRTNTTRDRMNRFCGLRGWPVFTNGGVWYVKGPRDRIARTFYDGIRVRDGRVVRNPDRAERSEEENTRRAIARYCRGIESLDTFPTPEARDCWGCLFSLNQVPSPSQGFGPDELVFGTDHLFTHFEEEYYPGALFALALLWRGHKLPFMIAWYRDRWTELRVRRDLAKIVKRFLFRMLGM